MERKCLISNNVYFFRPKKSVLPEEHFRNPITSIKVKRRSPNTFSRFYTRICLSSIVGSRLKEAPKPLLDIKQFGRPFCPRQKAKRSSDVSVNLGVMKNRRNSVWSSQTKMFLCVIVRRVPRQTDKSRWGR